MKIVFMYL